MSFTGRSPALRGQPYCYFHNEWRTRSLRRPVPRFKHPPTICVTTRHDIQHALNHVLRGLLAGYIGPHCVALALNTIQLASTNLGRDFIRP